MRRVLLLSMLLAGCEPSFDWSLQAVCTETNIEYAIAIESGGCGNASGTPKAFATLVEGEITLPELATLEPGEYCFAGLAYHRDATISPDTNGYRCRLEALDRETRQLPAEREGLVSELRCENNPPSGEVFDNLLRSVAGCCPNCDVERCTCSAGCPVSDTDPTRCGSACPRPVQVRELAISDHFVCGISVDQQSLVCWGDGLGGPPSLRTAFAENPGIAQFFSSEQLTGTSQSLLAIDADGDRLCFNTAQTTECIDGVVVDLRDVGGASPTHVVASNTLTCFGEGTPNCVKGTDSTRISTTSGARMVGSIDYSGTDGYICAIASASVHCATEASACGSCDPFSSCSCSMGSTGCRCRVEPVTSSSIAIDAGWGLGCSVGLFRNVQCWSFDGPDAATPNIVLDGTEELKASDVSVGRDHICIRRVEGNVECGVLQRVASGYQFVDREIVTRKSVDDFVAGPDGISCVVRSETARVFCHQLSGFDTGVTSPLMGVAHTTVLSEERPVCP